MSCEAGTIVDVYLKWLLQVEKFHLSFASSCHSYQRALRSSFVRERKKRMKNKQPRTRAEEWVRVKLWRRIPWSARCSNFPFICFLPFSFSWNRLLSYSELNLNVSLLDPSDDVIVPQNWKCWCWGWRRVDTRTRIPHVNSIPFLIFQVCWTFWKIFYSFCCRLSGLTYMSTEHVNQKVPFNFIKSSITNFNFAHLLHTWLRNLCEFHKISCCHFYRIRTNFSMT